MLNNFRNLNSLYQSLGARWLMFRLGYGLRMRTGLLRKQIPAWNWQDRPLETWLKKSIPSQPEAYAQWRRQNSPRFFFEPLRAAMSPQGERSGAKRHTVEARIPSDTPWDPQEAVAEAERVLNGELRYFAHKFIKTGFPPDWHQDPVSGIKVDANKHWSQISNEGDVDIKFVWEASRFGMTYPLVRAYASTRDERFAEAFWRLVRAWAESNPPNTGPNWMDGQEAALRLLAWTFGFYAFLNSPSTTPARIAQLTVVVAAHAERIHKNIDYAISTRSNHTISEAFGLWLVGLLFPELKDAEKHFALGRKLLEQEGAAQIFPDGGYSMYSLNYHRFILHLYFYAIRLGELNGSPFSEALKDRLTRSVDYLCQLIDPETGQMPVYGSNDGALVLPLNNCDFTDYRPLLQLGAYLTRKEWLFTPGPWDEDLFWLCGEDQLHEASAGRVMAPALDTPSGLHLDTASPVDAALDQRAPRIETTRAVASLAFPHAGTYLLRGERSQAVLRCTDFRSRPSHADQLHMDLWWRGRNIACDAGTFLYSGEGVWRNGLAHTSVHNTVIVDHQDQMKRVSRFIWTHWSSGKVLQHNEKSWQGEHNGYRRLADPVRHRRTVFSLEGDRWLVLDHLNGKQVHHYSLHWLLDGDEYGVQEFAPANFGIKLDFPDSSLSDSRIFIQMGLRERTGRFSILRGDERSTRGWRSRYYGDKEFAISAMLETDQPHACFWTFFGFESDLLEWMGQVLKVISNDQETLIDLAELNKGIS